MSDSEPIRECPQCGKPVRRWLESGEQSAASLVVANYRCTSCTWRTSRQESVAARPERHHRVSDTGPVEFPR